MSITYDGGAKRSRSYPRFRDVPYCLIRRIANAFAEGAAKYEKEEDGFLPFEKNWQNGNLNFALDALDHTIRHAHLYKEVILARLNDAEADLDPEIYDLEDDHLANCGANLGMLAWFEEHGFFEPINYDAIAPPDELIVPAVLVPEDTTISQTSNTTIDKIKSVFGIGSK